MLKLLSYTDRLWARPGDSVAVHASADGFDRLDVELVREGNTLLCRFAERTLRLALGSVSEASLKSLDRPKKALLGIRPSDLLVGGSAREQTIEGRVFLVEPVGPVTFLDVDVEGRVVKAACDPDTAPVVGEVVPLGFADSRVRLFDQATEQRL